MTAMGGFGASLLFGNATLLCGHFAIPTSGRHACCEQIAARRPALRRIIVVLLAIRETDLLAVRACDGKGRRCRKGADRDYDKQACPDDVSHDLPPTGSVSPKMARSPLIRNSSDDSRSR